jgi:hypothetical protein
MKGSANAAWITLSGEKPSGPTKKYGGRAQNRRGGAPEARVPVTRHAAPQGADEERSAFRRSAPLTHVREKGRKAPPRASP